MSEPTKTPKWRMLVDIVAFLFSLAMQILALKDGHWDQATFWLVLTIFQGQEIRRLTGK